jgi:hypothetical protein
MATSSPEALDQSTCTRATCRLVKVVYSQLAEAPWATRQREPRRTSKAGPPVACKPRCCMHLPLHGDAAPLFDGVSAWRKRPLEFSLEDVWVIRLKSNHPGLSNHRIRLFTCALTRTMNDS